MFVELEKKLEDALTCDPPDYVLAKELLAQGANINARDRCGDFMAENCLYHYGNFLPECNVCEEKLCIGCQKRRRNSPVSMVEFFIQNGWDTVSSGLDAIGALVHTTHDEHMFYAAKRILECPLPEGEEAYEDVLESIGTEESYQRCCEHCHEQENLYYVMYEMVQARMEGRDFQGFHPYHRALGRRVDKIVYFADTVDFAEIPRGTEYQLDFGFICGAEVVVIGPNVNVFFRNDLLNNQPQIDISSHFGQGIVGAVIADISFDHASICRERSEYGQPIIILKFDSGREIRFTHNFGEFPQKPSQARFWISDTFAQTC